MRTTQYIILISFLVLLYGIVMLMAFIFQKNILFHPIYLKPNAHLGNGFPNAEEVFIQTPDNEKINAVFFRSPSEKVILYFHGNAGNLESWQHVYADFQHLNYNFLIIDYRGYGKSTGTITEKGFYTDGYAAFDFLEKQGFMEKDIIVVGRSIGTGVAVELAQHKKGIRALILESPYTSLEKLAQSKAPYLFPQLWIRFHFDNLAKMRNIQAPLLIIHGTNDQLIPIEQGIELYDTYDKAKDFVQIKGGEHNNLSSFPVYRQEITSFLKNIKAE